MPSFHDQPPTVWFNNGIGDILLIRGPEKDAWETWQRLREAVHLSGRWPIVVGKEIDLEIFRRDFGLYSMPVAKSLAEAEKVDVNALIEAEVVQIKEEDEEQDPEDRADFDFDPSSLQPSGEVQKHPGFLGERGEIAIALLPTEHGWEAPAQLGYGSWNCYPAVPDHVALLRYWHQKHGAEVVTFTHDVVELYVAKSVQDLNAAKRLAIEWYVYSRDNVDQGSDSLQELACSLIGSHVWFSWWD